METTHTLTTADGACIAYRRWHAVRPSGRPPLVLMHGAASNMTRWSEFLDDTALKATHDILRLDLRGHGQSLYRGKTGLEIWCDDLAAILKQEDIPQAVVGGHCLGANIAAEFAARHPFRTAGVVLIEPMLTDALTGALGRLRLLVPLLRLAIVVIRLFTRLGIHRRRMATLDLRELDREFRRRLAGPGGSEALVRRYASPLHDLKIMPAASFLQDLVEVTRPLPLHAIRAPFLALLSTGRTFADPDRTQRRLAPFPNGEIHTLDAKHWIPTEQPQAMRRRIETWLASLTSPSTLGYDLQPRSPHMSSKHAFVEDLKARLDKLDTELSQLEVRAQQAGADARATYEAKLSMLRQKRAEAKQKYTELHAAGENAWEHLKRGAEDAWASLRSALDKARSEFKS